MLAEQSLYFTVALCYNHFEEERNVTVMSVGENIAYFRKKLGLTQEMLSERIGVTAQAVSKWENGVTNPDISLLPRISEALGIGIGDLFDGSRERRAVGFGQLPDAAYDAVLSVFRRARCDFYGIDAVVTDGRIREVRENISARGLRAVSVNASETGHGARSICRMRFRMSTAGTAAAIRRCCLTCAAREICFRRSGAVLCRYYAAAGKTKSVDVRNGLSYIHAFLLR